MAKIYDALKRAQDERSQHGGIAVAPVVADAEAVAKTRGEGLRRWAGWIRVGSQREPVSPSDTPTAQLLQGILGRLDALEKEFSQKLPEVEGRLLQNVEARFQRLESELVARLSDTTSRLADRSRRLTFCASLLMGGVIVMLLLLVLRS